MISRRTLLKTTGCGFGYLAFSSLANWSSASTTNPLAARAGRHCQQSQLGPGQRHGLAGTGRENGSSRV